MGEGNSIINLGDLAKPATVLIEKVAEATGILFEPRRIVRKAKADAEAAKIQAVAEIEISEIQKRGLQRFIFEQGRDQEHLENILKLALPQVKADAQPGAVEKDWISNFFDKSRLTFDEEMQQIWARILAGEANSPGKFSKRTVNFLSSLDKSDALLFTKLCGFSGTIREQTPLIYNAQDVIYEKEGLNFSTLNHLASIGLITFDNLRGFVRKGFTKKINVNYQGTGVDIEFPQEEKNDLSIGQVLLTTIGHELAQIVQPEKVEGFYDYVMLRWAKEGLVQWTPVMTQSLQNEE